ncbi:MAG TPA: PAS domain-containing protein [Terriglobales bacterium]|nr:PAS domain-containing protein [Terriglobales bacterium]
MNFVNPGIIQVAQPRRPDMEGLLEDPAQDIKRLQRCINDLISLLALPAMWSSDQPSQIVHILLDALLRMLSLDFTYARLKDCVAIVPIEILRIADSCKLKVTPQEIGGMVSNWFEGDGQKPLPSMRDRFRDKEFSRLPVPLGVHGEIGMIVAGSGRADFPRQTESLLLSVAANQASTAMREARLLSEQKRIANELDQRVAERASALGQANEELRKEIDERKKIEERLRESEAALQRAFNEIKKSEAKLRQVIDTIPTLAWCNLPDGPNEFLNKGWHEYTGLSPEESHGWGWQVAFHPEDLPPLMKRWQELLVSGEPGEIEARLRHYDGVYRWFLIRAEPLRDDAGKIVRWYGTSTDIEDRKRAEEALKASEREFGLIINTIPAMAWSARPDGYAEFFNQHYLAYVGLPLEQLQGSGWTVAVHPDDLDAVAGTWQSIMASGKPGEGEARLRRFDGEYRWFLFRANPMLDESGNILKWYGTNTDIDDRKRAEEQLWRSEAFLAAGQNLSRIGSFSWKAATDEITWSEQLYRIYQFEIGVPVTLELIRTRVHREDLTLLEKMIEQARNGRNDFEWQYRLMMPDQSIKYLHAVAHATRDQDGQLQYIAAVQDVTARRMSEEALGKARSELAKVARVTSLGVLTASIAHEINQPLSGIITNAGTCLRMLSADPPNVEGARETARRTIRDGNRASDVITRLRTLYSKKDPQPELMDLNEAAQEVTSLSLSELQRNRVILRQEFAEDLPPVRGDRIQLQQVMLNLLRNASDAMSAVDDRPRELVIRTERDDGDRVRLSVKDAGVGFPPQASDKLFEAFYTTKTDGMGIGLSISRSIIEAHHGRLWATPNDGPGATFSFAIPCRLEGWASGGTGVNRSDPATNAA